MTNFLSSFILDPYCLTQLQGAVSLPLLLYSHIPTAIITLIVGIFLLTKNRKLETKIFFALTITFFVFTLGDLTEWFVFLGRNPIIFTRSVIELMDPLLFILSSYFLFVLIKKRDMPLVYKIIGLLPIVVYAGILVFSFGKNLITYNWDICEVAESNLVASYGFYMDLLYTISAVSFAIWSIIKNKERRREISIISAGVCSFMVLFFVMEFIFSGYILGGVFNYSYFLYAFFGMPILIGFLGYLIVKYNEFNIKLLATQALVWGLVALIGAEFFFIQAPVNFVLTGITFIASIIFGNFLIRSVKKEVEQKEELQKLNVELKNLIAQRESLVHLVTHKVKSSFTRSKYIFAGMLDGTFGKISEEIKNIATQGLESDNTGIQTVDLVLNAANMQKGAVKYDMKVVDFKDIVLKTFTEKKVQGEAKGLQMESNIKSGADDVYKVLGDAFWLKEAVNNLIDNSIKYTKTGKITVGLEDGNGKAKFSVKDTGIGITDEDKKNLFTEGGRGKDSVKTNVDSTGYGLYSVKLIIEKHKGKVWVESVEGKGSTFYLELDAVSEEAAASLMESIQQAKQL